MPIIANKTTISSNSNPRLPIAGAAITIVSKIICNFFARLIILKTRRTRKILTIVAYVAISSLILNTSRRTAVIEPMTTMKSKIFQLLAK